MNLGQAIKELRIKKGFNQGDFAAKCNITQAYLSLIENNKKEPNLSTLKKISSILDTPLPIIFFRAINEEDIPKENKEIYNTISPSINELISTVFFLNDKNKE
jgi:transcriptional regulator with XRE-family HTH domain